jgi:hypothetical protein
LGGMTGKYRIFSREVPDYGYRNNFSSARAVRQRTNTLAFSLSHCRSKPDDGYWQDIACGQLSVLV